MHDVRERPHVLDRVIGLVLDGALRPFADDEMRLDVAGQLQRLEETHAEDGAGRSGHADNEASHRKSFRVPAEPLTGARGDGTKQWLPFWSILEQVPEFADRQRLILRRRRV